MGWHASRSGRHPSISVGSAAVELRQLQAFVAVATQLHFGRAAEQLNIGQPTLTELVQRLERELGTPLLRRSTRPIHLTEAGSEFLLRARALLDDAAEAVTVLNRISTRRSR